MSGDGTPNGAEERPATVLQVLPALVSGGVERGTVDVAAALAAAGAQALIASAGGPMAKEAARLGARHFGLPLRAKNPLRLWRNAGKLARLIRAEQVDIVHARSRAPAWSAYWAARRTGRIFITTFHGAYNFGSELKRRYNAVMAKGERVIAISHFIAEHVQTHYGVPAERIRVIPRGVDLAQLDPDKVHPERLAVLAKAWRLPDGATTLLLPARVTRWKGHAVVLDALAALARPEVVCVFAGDDQGKAEYRRDLERQIERLGLGEQVRFVGACRDMPAAYLLADVVVSASTDPEAFGRVAAEAQAMGRPIIASDHGGSRETVVPGVTGWLTPPNDAAALTAAIREALDLTPERRAALATAGRAYVAERFTKEKMCAATLALYDELLAERGHAP